MTARIAHSIPGLESYFDRRVRELPAASDIITLFYPA